MVGAQLGTTSPVANIAAPEAKPVNVNSVNCAAVKSVFPEPTMILPAVLATFVPVQLEIVNTLELVHETALEPA